jgi:hypothetical protein
VSLLAFFAYALTFSATEFLPRCAGVRLETRVRAVHGPPDPCTRQPLPWAHPWRRGFRPARARRRPRAVQQAGLSTLVTFLHDRWLRRVYEGLYLGAPRTSTCNTAQSLCHMSQADAAVKRGDRPALDRYLPIDRSNKEPRSAARAGGAAASSPPASAAIVVAFCDSG